MKEIIIAVLIIGFLLISFKIASDKVKEKIEAESEVKKRQEEYNNKLKKLEDTFKSLEPFMKSFKGITSHVEFHFYDSRNIFGESMVNDKCVEIFYRYKNYSDSFILYVSDMDEMKRRINNKFLNTKIEYDLFENNKIRLENVKSESLEADATSLYTETITGKIIYKDETSIKEITGFVSSKFPDVTNFKFYEERINHNKFYIEGLKEREFEIERRIF